MAKARSILRSAIPRALWRQWPIKLETDFIVKRKLAASLEGAGASLDSVVKAQVYLSDREDVPGLQRNLAVVHFKAGRLPRPSSPPQSGFVINDLRIEINTISLATARQDQRGGYHAAPKLRRFDGWVSAIKCGDLLFLSGLYGRRERTPRLPRPDRRTVSRSTEFRSRLSCAAIIRPGRSDLPHRRNVRCGTLCASSNFTRDLADLPAAIEVWNEAMAHAPLPLSPIEVAWLSGPRWACPGRPLGLRSGSVIRKSGCWFSEKITLQTRNLGEFIFRSSEDPPCRRSDELRHVLLNSRRRPVGVVPSTR